MLSRMRHGLIAAAAAATLFGSGIDSRAQTIASPNGAIVVTVTPSPSLTYSVALRGTEIIAPSQIGMTLAGGETLGAHAVLVGSTPQSVDRVLRPVAPTKRSQVRDHFNERRFDFRGDYSLIVRVFDDGIAYRFAMRRPGEITVTSEQTTFRFRGNPLVYFPEETSLISHQERLYKKLRLAEIASSQFSGVPVLVALDGGPRIAITEADLLDYPGMDLKGGGDGSLVGAFAAYPLKTQMDRDRTENVTERADYIARTKGTREFPWRTIVVAERDATLLESDIVYRLASPTALTDTSWIRPGKVAWDWWNYNNVYGVPFRAGVNTDTYKHYIDFAAENGLEYVILDEGWYELGNLMKVAPAMDMDALASYARQKNVGLILWVVWKTLDQQLQPALDQFVKWGVKGIKVDFMQREDQWMVNYYERIAREAASRKLLVDFHGAYKPTGLYRTWPNVVTSEGVLGLEHDKWSADSSPDHTVTFPFIRMLAGPVDYTPGAMMNATKADFKPIFNRPMSQGTRCQQLAMYVVLESPVQMLADSPSNYRKEPESLTFVSKVPTVWDETRVLSAAVGEHILVARRSGADWYVAGMTNWTARDLELDLSFLDTGGYDADLFADGPNADRAAVDYTRTQRRVTSADKIALHLAPGGGFAAHFVRR
jgi:alpha-glucosidase